MDPLVSNRSPEPESTNNDLPERQEDRRAALLGEVDGLIKEFRIHMDDTIVEVSLPTGKSRFDFIQKVNEITNSLYKLPAVEPQTLASWKQNDSFNETHATEQKILLNGNVKDSTGMSRQVQNSKGLNNVELRDLAVAHSAYLLINESDLFKGNAVRAREGQLSYCQMGLTTKTYFGELADPNVAASAYHSWKK
jgi:hypothetical protein